MPGAFNDGLRGEGILSCGKHFPGYSRRDRRRASRSAARSSASRAELDAEELAVFRHFADDASTA